MISNKQLDLWGKHIEKKLKKGEQEERLLLQFCDLAVWRTEHKKDTIVGISGIKGSGKSTLGIIIAMMLRLRGMNFDSSHIIHGQSDMKRGIEKITTTKRGVFIFDEIIKMGYSRDAMKGVNKKLIMLFTIARKLGHVIILNIPVFKRLDSGLGEDNVNYWFHIYWRSMDKERDRAFARAGVVSPNLNLSSDDPWGLRDQKLSKMKVLSAHAVLNMLKGLPGYIGEVSFPPLPLAIEEQYLDDSTAAIKEFGEEFTEMLSPKSKKPEKQLQKPEVPDSSS